MAVVAQFSTMVAALLALPLGGCSSAEEKPTEVIVSSLTVGLMSQRADGSWRIYSKGNRFPFVYNGPCFVEGRSQECLWYGFEFDYSASKADLTLICKANFNKPTDVVNADSVNAADAHETTFDISLSRAKGHISRAANVYKQPDDTPAPWTVHIACSHDGKELLRFDFTALHEY